MQYHLYFLILFYSIVANLRAGQAIFLHRNHQAPPVHTHPQGPVVSHLDCLRCNPLPNLPHSRTHNRQRYPPQHRQVDLVRFRQLSRLVYLPVAPQVSLLPVLLAILRCNHRVSPLAYQQAIPLLIRRLNLPRSRLVCRRALLQASHPFSLPKIPPHSLVRYLQMTPRPSQARDRRHFRPCSLQ